MKIAHAIASAKLRKFACPHKSSPRNSASWVRSLILVSIGNLACSCVSPLPDNLRGRTWPAPPKQRDLSASGCCSGCSGDLVEGGIGNLIGLYLRSSVNHLRQSLRHFGVSSAVVGFRVLCLVPQTDAECFLSSRCDKRDFVPESVLFSKQGKNFPFQRLGELGNAALQMHGDFTCKHVNLLGWRAKGDSDNLLWYRQPESTLSALTKIG